VPSQVTPLTSTRPLDHYRKALAESGLPFPFAETLDFRLTEVEPGRAVMELACGRPHENTFGTVHGGVYCSVADTAMGIAHGSLLGDGEISTTVDLQITVLQAMKGGHMRAEAKVVKNGRTLAFVECDVTDGEGNLVARASSNCMRLTGRGDGNGEQRDDS
jgi:uncharacterized protein (TIGR00369 family)